MPEKPAPGTHATVWCMKCCKYITRYQMLEEDQDLTGFDDDWSVSSIFCDGCGEDGHGEIYPIGVVPEFVQEEGASRKMPNPPHPMHQHDRVSVSEADVDWTGMVLGDRLRGATCSSLHTFGRLLLDGDYIAAMKKARVITGCTIKEAKDMVQRLRS